MVDAATFASDAVDDSTTEISSGAIIVKTGGITHSQLATDSVKEAKIVDLSVSTAKIANDAITEAKIADNAIQAEHYSDGSIAEEHLNDNVISGQAELAEVPHLTQDEVLISDNGTLKRRLKFDLLAESKQPSSCFLCVHNFKAYPLLTRSPAHGRYYKLCTTTSTIHVCT